MTPHNVSEHQVVAFTVDGVGYALRIRDVKEIIRYVEPQPTTAHATWMRGVINLRGTIVPVWDLGMRLRGASPITAPRSRVLILETPDGLVGAIVDSVDEVQKVRADQVEAAPPGSDGYVVGVLTGMERLVMLLEVGELLDLDAEPIAA